MIAGFTPAETAASFLSIERFCRVMPAGPTESGKFSGADVLGCQASR